MMERYHLGLDYLAHYHDAIYAISRDDVLEAARHYLDPERFVIAVAGPNGKA
jgi:predicted Zn-dependent peptidase